MEISNQKTIFLGTGKTGNLSGINKILIYNTECFSGNFNIYLRGEKLQEKILSILSEKPTESSVKEIYTYLVELDDEYGNKIYKDIPSRLKQPSDDDSSVIFDINLGEYDYFSQGFNVILYLDEGKEILGFTIFDEPRGKTISDDTRFVRYYSIDNITLTINYTGIIDINGDTINLVGEVSDIAEDLDLTGKENYNYNTLETIKKEDLSYNNPVYSDNINFLVKNHYTKNLLSGSFYYRLGSEKYNTKLPLKSITLPSNDFDKFQVGFYKGDIVLYTYTDSTYYITSLTKTGRGSVYTVPKKDYNGNYISKSNYYIVPDKAEIDHFSGGFIYTTDNRVFSIQDQTSPMKDTGTNNSGWLNGRYVVDTFDISGKIYKLPEENIIVRREAEKYFPGISSVYLDIENYLKYYTLNVVGKCGDWYIIKESLQSGKSFYIYTNMTKTVKFPVSEKNITPMIINNEVLMLKEELDSNKTEYTFFDEPGNYIYGDTECPCGCKRSDITVTISNDDSPTILQTSYFSRFRRNILPDSLTNFDIIATFGGLIFYKKDLNISYL